jgi:copper(I)-binding protein
MRFIGVLFGPLAVILLSLSFPLAAEPFKAGSLTVEAVWARPSVGTRGNSAAYCTIHNAGSTADRLVAAATPYAGKVELHTHIRDGDVMRMRPVEGGIPVPAGGMVALKPGGYHVMIMQLKQPIVMGGTLPLTLTFEKAGAVTVQASVQMKPGMTGHRHK